MIPSVRTTVMQHETARLRRSARLKILLAAALLVLMSTVAAGVVEFVRIESERTAAANGEFERWDGQGAKNPHAATHYGIHVFKPRSIASVVDPGLEAHLGSTVMLESHRRNLPTSASSTVEGSTTRFGVLSPADVFFLLLPLGLIILGFDAIAGEREKGILPMVFANGARPFDYAIGKIAAHTRIALITVLLPMMIAAIAAAFLVDRRSIVEEIGRILLIGATWAAVAVGTVGITIFVSLFSRTSRASLAILFGMWIVGFVILPRAVSQWADRRYPTPSLAEYTDERRQITRDARGRDGGLSAHMERVKDRLLKEHGVPTVGELPVSWGAVSMQAEEEFFHPLMDAHAAKLFDAYESQLGLLDRAGSIFPPIAARSMSMSLARTDWRHQEAFLSAAEDLRRVMVKTLNDDLALHSKNDPDYAADEDLWSKVPRFEFEYPSLASVFLRALGNIGSLVVWCLAPIVALFVFSNRAPRIVR